ncbi:MAG: MauE/DoxX family redox-associated membrane protein [Phycisphaerae bacterium]
MSARASWVSRADASGIPLLLARLFVGLLFVWLAWAKIADPINFLKLMRQYELVDEQTGFGFMNFITVVLPWLELLCGLALLAGVALRAAGILSAGMLLAFTPLIFSRGLDLFHEAVAGDASRTFCSIAFDCGCGAGEINLCFKLLENTALLLATVLIVASRSRRFCLGRPRPEVLP